MGVFDAALLATFIGVTAPILLAASGELISERAGVLNVGLEGMMLAGAFFGFFVAYELDNIILGVLSGAVAGLLFAVVMSVLAIEAKADQIVAGIGINVLAIGITSFSFDQIFSDQQAAQLGTMGGVEIPILSSLGGVGQALFNQPLLAYLSFLLIPMAWFLLYRTRWGLSIRSVGELPTAADTSGISVRSTRWFATLTAGALAGLGGVYLSLVELGLFRQEMTAGRGFLALAAVIFGRWKPKGVLLACLLFGGADALQLRLQASGTIPTEVWLVAAAGIAIYFVRQVSTHGVGGVSLPSMTVGLIGCIAAICLAIWEPLISMPSQLWLALPFLLALVALASAKSRVLMPAALTLPYRRGEA